MSSAVLPEPAAAETNRFSFLDVMAAACSAVHFIGCLLSCFRCADDVRDGGHDVFFASGLHHPDPVAVDELIKAAKAAVLTIGAGHATVAFEIGRDADVAPPMASAPRMMARRT